MSICLVLECCTGLFAIFIVLSLSHKRGTSDITYPKSFRVCRIIQSSSAQQLPATTYSASVHRATKFCLLEDHETKDRPKNCQVPDVLFLQLCHRRSRRQNS